MDCNFSKRQEEYDLEVIQAKMRDVILQVSKFKYLGSIIQDDGVFKGTAQERKK